MNSNLIKDIVKAYFISKKQCNIMAFSSGDIDYSNPYYKYYHDVEKAFDRLNDDEKLVINNDYFFNDYYGWWKYLFTERAYLSLKKRAEKHFLRYFYEIH